MLTQEEKQQIEAEFERYPHKQAACIEALKVIQQQHGWVSDDHLKDVAEFLDMTADELENVATFYNIIFRQPVGEHVIRMCDSVSCWIMGYERLRESLTKNLKIEMGETTQDNLFTMVPIQCLGVCEQAPALMVDDDLYTSLNLDNLEHVLQIYRQEQG